MLRINPFAGLRPAPEHAHRVACVPYDVVSREEAAQLAAGNPCSLLHVDRAEIDLPAATDPYSPEVYAKAAENLRRLQHERVLIRESQPCTYLYRQIMGDHVQTGIAAVCHIDDYETLIKTHEKTRKDKEADRTHLIDTLSANTGPVFLTYRDQPQFDERVAELQNRPPLYDFVAPDQVRHTVWRVSGEDGADLRTPVAYVADGHHRTAAAVTVGRQRRAQNPQHAGDENYNWFLCVLFPASQLQILPYNRSVRDLCGRSVQEFLELARKKFRLSEDAPQSPSEPGHISMYVNRKWHGLSWDDDPSADLIARLDVSVLQDRLLAPVLGIDDPRTSARINFVGGIRGPAELERKVDSGKAAVAFSMYPTTVEQMMAIADAGEIMPPKSTWFEPKLRSGLFINVF